VRVTRALGTASPVSSATTRPLMAMPWTVEVGFSRGGCARTPSASALIIAVAAAARRMRVQTASEPLQPRPSARGTRRSHLCGFQVPWGDSRLERNIAALRQVVEPRVAYIAAPERVRLAVLPKERPGAMVALQPCDSARHVTYIMTEPGLDCALFRRSQGFLLVAGRGGRTLSAWSEREGFRRCFSRAALAFGSAS
jgi:hypothetical protein